MNRFIIVISLLLILTPRGSSQEVTPEAELDYTIEEFTLPGGRLGNNVNAIVQGPYGFMWFATHGGLHRYDGNEFVTFKSESGDTTVNSGPTLSFNYMENLYWDRSNKLWICTYGGGLFKYDPEIGFFTNFSPAEDDSLSISHTRILCAVEDSDGNMWFGTERGLNKFDPKTEIFTRYIADGNPGSLINDDVRNLYVDDEGTLWVGSGFYYWSNHGALSKYDRDSDSFINYQPDLSDTQIAPFAVRGMLVDKSGNFWIGTTNGLQRFDRKQETFEWIGNNPELPKVPGSNSKDDILPTYPVIEDREGNIWIGTIENSTFSSHLSRYDPINGTSQFFPSRPHVWNLCESSDGTIWTAGAGNSSQVLKITPKTKTYDLLGGESIISRFRSSDYYRSKWTGNISIFGPTDMAIDPNTGHHWVGLFAMDGMGRDTVVEPIFILAEYNPQNKEIDYHPIESLNTRINASDGFDIFGIIIDDASKIWFSLPPPNVGVVCFDPRTSEIEEYLHDPNDTTSISSNNIQTLMRDRSGNIWAATRTNGLNRINPKTKEVKRYHFNLDGSGIFNQPWSMVEDKDGKIWVGGNFFSSDGFSYLTIIDPKTDSMTFKKMPNYGTSYSPFSMTYSSLNGGIIAFTNGTNGTAAYLVASDQFNDYNTSLGTLPFDNVGSIVSDDNGVFWLTETQGSRFIRIEAGQKPYIFEEDSRAPNSWRRGILGPNGHVYFMNQLGWVDIDPQSFEISSVDTVSRIQLVDLYVLGEQQKPGKESVIDKPLWLLDELTLPNEAENFGIRFSDMNFKDEKTQFQYRLLPYESVWKPSGVSPIANYYQVPPGEYTFQVMSALEGAVGGSNISEIKISVKPPWWKTWWAYTLYAIALVFAGLRFHKYQQVKTIRQERERQREKELAHAREIEKAYADLKATQNQLIQSEKMASLGELTAGIAHEIQNPLNFVNNFSELNKELIQEMHEEIQEGNLSEATSISKDIMDNEDKILYHGKRAEGIVKSMLLHSRDNSGKKEPTDLNELCDEYIRLAYHGMRAKDKEFNAEFSLDLMESLPKVDAVPQDIGRVILNLVNNAFYTVNERRKSSGSDYKPIVLASTLQVNSQIQVRIKDNGNGMPEAVKKKIFQPFYSTKPTGQGTGLGLSLSYDIIKAHGGDIQVESQEGTGTEFKIVLPLK